MASRQLKKFINPKTKYTDKTDDAYDKTHKIKEGSKADKALDKKRGIPEDEGKKKVKK